MNHARRALTIREGTTPILSTIDAPFAAEIGGLGIGRAEPLRNGDWRLSGISKVGVLRIGSTELRIEPKLPISRVLHLLSVGRQWGTWMREDVSLDTIDDLYRVIAEVFALRAERTLDQGVLQDYVEMRAADPVIRGRWLIGEQLRRRQGLPLPAELQYDDYTVDVIENRMIRSAARRLLGMDRLPVGMRTTLRRIDRRLADVTVLPRGHEVDDVFFDRRNERYRDVLVIARLILSNGSLEHRAGDVQASGFLLDLSKVFEDFVEVAIRDEVRGRGGTIVAQHTSSLDVDRFVRIRPDVVWLEGSRVRAVFDVKYKAEKPEGYPNADIYQMLAYCIRHEVTTGHLVYAKGETTAARYVIEQAGVTVMAHALDLDCEPDELRRQVRRLVEIAAGSGSSSASARR